MPNDLPSTQSLTALSFQTFEDLILTWSQEGDVCINIERGSKMIWKRKRRTDGGWQIDFTRVSQPTDQQDLNVCFIWSSPYYLSFCCLVCFCYFVGLTCFHVRLLAGNSSTLEWYLKSLSASEERTCFSSDSLSFFFIDFFSWRTTRKEEE